MQPDHTKSASSATIWVSALAAAALGSAILFESVPGVNWGLWVAFTCATVLVVRSRSGLKIGPPLYILFGWATLLAFALAITDNGPIQSLVIISDAMLLGLAIVVIGVDRWRSLSVELLPVVPFLAVFRVWLASLREAVEAPKSTSSQRARPIIKGVLILVPIVFVLLALLRNADPVISWLVNGFTDFFEQWSFSARLVFFLFLLSVTLGANSLSGRQSDARLPAFPKLSKSVSLGVTEQRIVLVGVAVVLWLFVLLQISYLFHSPPSAVGSGITFADYARQGFAQIAVAATLAGAIILVLERTRAREIQSATASQLVPIETAILVALELALASAFRRVVLYENAYGFTVARVYSQAYILALAVALIALWLEIRKGGMSIDFGRRVSIIALATFTILAFWNHEAWIANRNVDRATVSGKFDGLYASRLSRDAVPTLLARRAEIPAAERTVLEGRLACLRRAAQPRWFEFNLRRRAANMALGRASLPACQPRQNRVPGAPVPPDTTPSATRPLPTTQSPSSAAGSGTKASSTREE
jgi:hypothetical protein